MEKIAKSLKSLFTFTGVTFFVFVLLELASYAFIRIHYQIDPLEKNQEIYGRKISGYYLSKNSPNFKIVTYDGDNNFKPNVTVTDSNGFIVDEPIQKTKPENTIRIFLIGGSTAFGYIQSQDIVDDKTYPSGTYDYSSSICGKLKKKLNQQFPHQRFEVINAAIPMHLFHQGYLQYLTLLHDFNPDIIINMDGKNDGNSIATGSAFKMTENEELDDLIKLKYKQPAPWPFSVFLLRYYLDRNFHREHHNTAVPEIGFSENDYTQIEPLLKQRSNTFIWTIASYENQLKNDSIHSIFVLQPLLHRVVYQKKLTRLEQKLLKNSQMSSLMDLSDPQVYSAIMLNGGKEYLAILGTNKTNELANIIPAYYYDRYFSARVDSIVTSTGNDFIDMNKEITGLSDTTEFYVDYCHLTPFGNEFTARKLFEHIDKYLSSKAGSGLNHAENNQFNYH